MVGALPWLFWFDPNQAPSISRHRRPDSTAANAHERRLYCVACHQVVTHLDERIAVRGATAHTVRNPYGIEFHIGCFKSAYGCRAHGDATQAYTWFPGGVCLAFGPVRQMRVTPGLAVSCERR